MIVPGQVESEIVVRYYQEVMIPLRIQEALAPIAAAASSFVAEVQREAHLHTSAWAVERNVVVVSHEDHHLEAVLAGRSRNVDP